MMTGSMKPALHGASPRPFGTLAAGLLLVAVTIGCATPSPPAQAQQMPAEPDAGLKAQTEAALADAAQRTRLDAGSLKIASAERVTWLDGSLGCPAPDLMYTQALVPGFRVRIVAGDQTLDYHADTRGGQVLCPPARAVDPARPRR